MDKIGKIQTKLTPRLSGKVAGLPQNPKGQGADSGPQSVFAKAAGPSELDRLLDSFLFPTMRVVLWLISLLILLLLVWSFFAELDEVATATGEVVPQGQVKVIQHLEGGVVEKILVEEGSKVRAGDLLMQLKLGASAVNRQEALAALDAISLSESRLIAETNGTNPLFDKVIAARRPELAQNELSIYHSRQDEQDKRIRVDKEKLNQRLLELQELQTRQKASKRDLSLSKQKLEMSGTLLEQGLMAKMDHLSLQTEVSKMEGDVAAMESSIPRAQAAVQEAQAQLAGEQDAYKRRANEELAEVRRKKNAFSETLNTASEQANRADITAPIDGVVKTLRFNTIGGVVRPGEPIMDLVPESEELLIQAKLDPKDRGYVMVGQPAEVKVSTYDYARYGGLDGEVERIGATSDMTQQGVAYYTIVIKTKKNYLGSKKGEFDIQPGMQAIVDVHTGKRSVIDYLVRPILKLRHEAFRER